MRGKDGAGEKAVVIGPQLLCSRHRQSALMPRKITALRAQRGNRRRISVYLDDKYAFGLQALIAAPLKVGQALSLDEIRELRERDEVEVAHDRALRFLSYRPRSCAEIAGYLKRRKATPAAIPTVVSKLVKAGLLDDEAFAQYWVENREAFRPRAKRLLRFELRRKGVPDDVIDQAVERVDEAESAYRAARDRARRLSQLDYQAFRVRLGGFLQRRGFGYGTAKETVARLWQELRIPETERMS